MSPVVVVGGPIHACKAYAALAYLRGLRALRGASVGVDVRLVVADNTDDGGRFARDLRVILPDLTILRPDWDRQCPIQVHERIRASSEAIRQHALELGASWLSVEADVLPAPEALLRLLELVNGEGLDAAQGHFYEGFDAARFQRSPFWLMGFSLITPRVLQEVPFRIELQRPNGYPDAFYGHDMQARGFRFGFHPDLVARHLEARGVAGRGWEAVRQDVERTRRYTSWLLGLDRDVGQARSA